MGKKDTLDRFYTKPEVARECVSNTQRLLKNNHALWIEPSAGSGAFLSLLPKPSIGIDIYPQNENIIKNDFLKMGAADFPSNAKKIIIGNPPFGVRADLAKQFIEQSIDVGAETIAFILPDIFLKYSNQQIFPIEWRLIFVEKLPYDSFELDGESYHVPCSFFVWTIDPHIEPLINMRETKAQIPLCYRFLKRGDTTAAFVINGNNGKLRNVAAVTNPKAEHYIAVADGYNKEDIAEKMSNLTYDFHSAANGGVAWINRDDINRTFCEKYGITGTEEKPQQ